MIVNRSLLPSFTMWNHWATPHEFFDGGNAQITRALQETQNGVDNNVINLLLISNYSFVFQEQ